MAKKAHESAPAKKKRKAQSVAPKEPKKGQRLGTVAIPVLAYVTLRDSGTFDELVIEWGCLGLSEEPDKITSEASWIDRARPITTSEEGLHVYFNPPLTGAVAGTSFGLQLLCTYNEAVEAKSQVPGPKENDELTFEQIEGEKNAPAEAEA